jgi:hypothetical protein
VVFDRGVDNQNGLSAIQVPLLWYFLKIIRLVRTDGYCSCACCDGLMWVLVS